jgi:hypothetical protein
MTSRTKPGTRWCLTNRNPSGADLNIKHDVSPQEKENKDLQTYIMIDSR